MHSLKLKSMSSYAEQERGTMKTVLGSRFKIRTGVNKGEFINC